MRIRLHVDRLVLEGIDLDSVGVSRLRSELARALTRLLARSGEAPTPRTAGGAGAVVPVTIGIGRTSDPARLGRAVARSVHGELTAARSTDAGSR